MPGSLLTRGVVVNARMGIYLICFDRIRHCPGRQRKYVFSCTWCFGPYNLVCICTPNLCICSHDFRICTHDVKYTVARFDSMQERKSRKIVSIERDKAPVHSMASRWTMGVVGKLTIVDKHDLAKNPFSESVNKCGTNNEPPRSMQRYCVSVLCQCWLFKRKISRAGHSRPV